MTTIRTAVKAELPRVLFLLESGLLSVSMEEIAHQIHNDRVLVALEDEQIVGVIVVSPGNNITEIENIVVQQAHRNEGIGRKLVYRACSRWGSLEAEFREAVKSFYQALGFDITPIDKGYRGRIDPQSFDTDT
ncbi:MAG: GNAT family N-acetyltransferase [Halobacteriaceae archaeon]